LLLEREASLEGGWLASALSHGSLASGVRALLDPGQPVQLEAVAGVDDRRRLLRETVAVGAAYRNAKALEVPAIGADLWFDQRIDQAPWGNPLTLMMAGLTALDTGVAKALALGRQDMALRLAERECGCVVRFGKGAPPPLMEYMAAFITVSGGLSREELREAARVESEATWAHPSERVGRAGGLPQGGAVGGDGVKAVEPDVVGEALLLRVWGGAENEEGSKAVIRAAKARGAEVAASVMRTAQDFCVGDQSREEPLRWLDALIAAGEGNFTLLSQLERALPNETLALRERAVRVCAMLAVGLRERLDTDPDATVQLARVLDNLGSRLSDLGRREEALEAVSDAVGLYWQLANKQNDAALALLLAVAFGNLGNRLADLRRHEEALRVTNESVRILRQMAGQVAGVFLSELATALGNLCNRLHDTGRNGEALEANNEAASIYRQLAEERPDEFLPVLATILSNRGGILREEGRLEEALKNNEQSVDIRRRLASERPDAFLPSLASSLNNLGNVLCDVGRRADWLIAMWLSIDRPARTE
jgi:tetratricopeptide (TPR) repeat protein